jgi:hypothetical protein
MQRSLLPRPKKKKHKKKKKKKKKDKKTNIGLDCRGQELGKHFFCWGVDLLVFLHLIRSIVIATL